MKKPKVYLCARVSEDAHKINQKMIDILSPYFEVFAPHLKEAELKDPKNPLEIYNLDLKAMEDADICIAIAPFGKDCAWEIGHFVGAKKPVFLYVPDKEAAPLNDWMIAGGISAIITDKAEVFHKIQDNFTWVALFGAFDQIGNILSRYYNKGGR